MTAIFAFLASALRSKTMVFNVLALVAHFLQLPELLPVVGPAISAHFVDIVAAINLILRIVTVKPLAEK